MHKNFITSILLLLAAAFYIPLAAQDTCDLDSQEAYIRRGMTKQEAEDHRGAIADYQCALNLNPLNVTALFARAFSYDQLGELDEAEIDYNAVLAILPNDAATYNNRGIIYASRGDYERAMADYDKAIELPYTEKQNSYFNRGLLNYELGDYAAALADLSAVIDLDSTDTEAYLIRAYVYQTQSDEAASLTDILAYTNLIRERTIDRDAAQAVSGDVLGMSEGSVFSFPFQAQADQIIRAAARTGSTVDVDPLLVLLGPDGQAVAWDDDSGVNLDAVFRYVIPANGVYTLLVTHAGGGSEGEVTLTLSISGAGIVDTPDVSADTFRAYSLAVNDHATVFASSGNRLNLRTGPGLDFEIASKLERDTNVTLLEGPHKDDGYNWWRIQTADGREGWAVERVEEEQTLHPALQVGEQAVVSTVEDTLRLREGPGTSFAVIVELPEGTLVTLLEGPQIADEFSWWKIRTTDDLEGWAAESIRTARTLNRFDEANQ